MNLYSICYRTLALPLVGAGIYECPKRLVAGSAMIAASNFLRDHPKNRHLKTIKLVVIEASDLDLF